MCNIIDNFPSWDRHFDFPTGLFRSEYEDVFLFLIESEIVSTINPLTTGVENECWLRERVHLDPSLF